MAVIAQLSAIITADTSGFERSMRSVSLGLSLAGAEMAALGASFGALIAVGSDVQQALVHVAGNTSMTAAEFDNLQQSVVRLGTTMPVALDDIGRAYMQAANFGFHFAEANIVVEAALKSAVATGADAEQTVRSLAIAMHQFNIPAEEAAKTMDVLHLAAARGGQTLEQFTAVTGRVFGVAHAMGISLVDAAAALSALTSSGLTAAQAATLLQGAIVKIANPAKQAQDEIKRLSKATGVDLVHDFSQAGLASKGLSGVMADISKAVGNNTAEILKLVPALRGGIGVILLTTTAAADYKARLQELADVMAGKLKPTQQDFERVMATVGAQAKITANAFEALGFEVVRVFGPTLVTALQTLNGILPQLVLFIGQLPPAIFAAAAAFSSMLVVIGTVMTAFAGLVTLLGGPLTLAIVGFTAAVGAMAAAVALNFNRVVAIFAQGSGAIKINFIALAGVVGALVDAFQFFAIYIISRFDIVITGAILMATAVKDAFNTMGAASQVMFGMVTENLGMVLDGLKTLRGATLDTAKSMSETIKGLMGRLATDSADAASHLHGEFAKSFAKAAMDAGIAFRAASAQQHAAMEAAGLKLVNAYLTGAVKGRAISAEVWHSMTDDARQAFIHTAELWVQSNTAIGQAIDTSNAKRKKQADEAAKALDQALKEQLDSVNDWLKAIDSKVSISEGVWRKLLAPDTKDSLLKAADTFHAVQDVIQVGQAKLLAAQISGFAQQKKAIDVSSMDYEQWGKEIEAVATKAGARINVVFPQIADSMKFVNLAIRGDGAGIKQVLQDIAFEHGMMAAKSLKAWNDLIANLPVTKFKEALKNLKLEIQSNPIFEEERLKDEASRAFEGVIHIVEREGERLGETQGEINARVLSTMAEMEKTLPPEMQVIAEQVIAAFKRNMDKLPGALDEIFNKLFLGTKHAVSGIFDVIANIPGKIGDTLRKGTDEFTKWVNQIDGILKGLHKIFQQIPDGLGPILQSVIGIFKKTTATVEDATHSIGGTLANVNATMNQTSEDWAGDLENMSNGTQVWSENVNTEMGKVVGVIQNAAAKGIAAIGAMVVGIGLVLSGHAQGGAIGAIQGALGGALAGATIGGYWAFATGGLSVLIGAVVGGIAGAIAGIFGGGKSAIQKEAERAQLDKLKADIAGTVQSTINAAIDGMKSALELFEKLQDFTPVPLKNIHRFFNQLTLVLQEFVELSKVFSSGMLDAAKDLADKMSPIIGIISNAVSAFDALGGFTGIAQVSIDAFASAMTRVLQSFISVKDKFLTAEGAIDSTVNQARKFAEKIGGVIEVIKNALDAFAGFSTFKNVLPETLDAFAATLQLAINKMGAIAEAVDKVMIKTAQRFSDRALSVVALIKNALDAFGPLATFAAVPAEAMNALFAGISDAVGRMQELAAALDTEMLTRAVAVAEKSSAIFGAIKAGVDALTSLVDFKAAAPEAFQALLDGFNQSVSILNQMLAAATQFETIAIQIQDKLTSAAQHLKDGAAAMAAGLAAAAAATGGTSGGGGSAGIASLSAGPSVTGFGIGAPSSPFASVGGSTRVETYHVNVTVQGSMIGTKAELQDVVVGAITQAQRRGRQAA